MVNKNVKIINTILRFLNVYFSFVTLEKMGCWDVAERRIYINKDLNKEDQLWVVLHEVGHAITPTIAHLNALERECVAQSYANVLGYGPNAKGWIRKKRVTFIKNYDLPKGMRISWKKIDPVVSKLEQLPLTIKLKEVNHDVA